jgi:hypothetical protein
VETVQLETSLAFVVALLFGGEPVRALGLAVGLDTTFHHVTPVDDSQYVSM